MAMGTFTSCVIPHVYCLNPNGRHRRMILVLVNVAWNSALSGPVNRTRRPVVI